MERQRPVRKHVRLSAYDYSTAGFYFITICTHRRQAVFGVLKQGHLIPTPAGRMAEQFLSEIPRHFEGVGTDLYCVMPDHVHAIVTIASVGPPYMAADRSKATLARVIQQYKSAVTRKTGIRPLWQEGYYDHILRNDADLLETRRYIQQNPHTRIEKEDFL